MALRAYPIDVSDGALGFGCWFAISEVHFRIGNKFRKDASESDLGKVGSGGSYGRAAAWALPSL